MIHQARSLTVDAAPDAVWAVLSRYIDEFAPQVTPVDALTSDEVGMGAKRRNRFANGTSLLEEVTAWKPGTGYAVCLTWLRCLCTRPVLKSASSQQAASPR